MTYSDEWSIKTKAYSALCIRIRKKKRRKYNISNNIIHRYIEFHAGNCLARSVCCFLLLFKAHGIVILFFCTSFVPRAHYWFEFHLECNDFSDLMWFNDSYQCLNAYVSNCALYELFSFPYRSLVNSKFLFAFHISMRLFALILH